MSTPPSLVPHDNTRIGPVEVSSGRVAAWVHEPDGEPRGTVILVHGFSGSKEDFILMLPLLGDAGWRVVAYDHLGGYESGPAASGTYSLAGWADDVAELAGAVGTGDVHLLGHSFGGLVAQRAVVRHPETFRSVALMCTGPGAVPAERRPELPLLIQVLQAVPMAEVARGKRDFELAMGALPAPDPAVEAFIVDRVAGYDAPAMLAMCHELSEAPSDVPALRASGVPALVLYGENDDAWPLEVQRSMAADLGGEPLVLVGAGHSPNVDQPEALAKALDAFWSSLP